jgi:hypothetical protein
MSDHPLDRAARSIADGLSVEWSVLKDLAASDADRDDLDCLQVLETVAAIHRRPEANPPADRLPSTAPPDDLASGEFAGTARFIVEHRLGSGAFGTVYQVTDRQRRARVALKMLHRIDPGALYRLKQEFRALADLNHANLVSLYELLWDEGRWFISMELVAGRDFVDYVTRSGRPAAAAGDAGPQAADASEGLRVVGPAGIAHLESALAQLAEGLRYLHAAGRLHRDIKPGNVLVTRDGRVVLLDFGLVSELRPGREETLDFGTPAYMSPEHGTMAGSSAACDWYGVGVMLFRALTGSLPFDGSFAEVIAAKRERDAPEPRHLVPDVPIHLNEICRRLLSRVPSVRLTAVEPLLRLRGATAGTTPSAAPSRGVVSGLPLVGRTAHLEALMTAYVAAKTRGAVTMYVHGGSGLGKTALVRRFLELVQQRDEDAVVLSGRCFERESVPYKALDSIVDALSRYLRGLPRDLTETLLPRDVLTLTRVFPVLRRVDAIAQARQRVVEIPDSQASQELRRRAFSAFRELLARLASRYPVVLCIDDLQWGDADSAALLTELMRPPDAPMLLLVAVYRTEDAQSSEALRTLLARGGGVAPGRDDVRELVVGELDASDASELAEQLFKDGSDGRAWQHEALVREAGGNPYLLAELVRYVKSTKAAPGRPLPDEEVPAPAETPDVTLDEMIMSRVRQLPDPARRMLEILAVFGQPLDPAIGARAAGVEAQELEVCALLRAERLSRSRVTADREEIETYHDRIRETVVAHLSPIQLRAHHHALALALESAASPDPDLLTVHFYGAEEHERAAAYAIAAAERAAEALAFDRASRLYRLALDRVRPDFPARHAIEVKLGDALANAGRGREAAHAYSAAAHQAMAAEQLELRRRAAEQLLRSGHLDEGFDMLRVVLDSIGMKLAPTPTRALLSTLARRAHVRLRGLTFRERDASQISPEALVRIDACWSVAMGLGIVDNVRGADFQARHLLLALRAGEPFRIGRAIAMEEAYASISNTRRARRRVAELDEMAQTLANRVNDPRLLGLLNVVRGTVANLHGHWQRSLELCEAAEHILRERCTGMEWELSTAHLYSLLSLAALGDLKQLSARLPALIEQARERDDLNAVVNFRTRLAYLPRLAADDMPLAIREVREGIANWSRKSFTAQHYFELLASTDVALYAGDGAAAWSLVQRSWPDLEACLLLRVQSVRVEALSFLGRAAVAAASGNGADRPRLLRAAERAVHKLRRDEGAHTAPLADIIAAGCAITRADQPAAIAMLERAAAGFEAADMSLHAAAARSRLEQLGRASQLAAADAWMKGQGIQNPQAMTSMLAPGSYSVA